MSLGIIQIGLCKYPLVCPLLPFLWTPGYLFLQFCWLLFLMGHLPLWYFFDRIFVLTWSMCNFSVVTLLERNFVTSCIVIPGHDWKYPFWISLIHVVLTGMNASAWIYLTKYVWFVVWYVMLILCSMSSCGLLFSNGTLRNPVYFPLVPVKIIFPSFMMWNFVCVKTALHPESHIFLIDINELGVSTAMIWPSLDLGGGGG